MDSGLTDEALVAQVFTNKDAYRLLVERYQSKLLRYIFRLGGGGAAEDLLQEAFLNAFQNLASFDRSLSFSSWMYRVTHNVVMSYFRKQRVRPEGNLHGDSEELLLKMWSNSDTEKITDTSLNGERLRRAMTGLKPLHRDVLTLRYFEELEYGEISDVLRIPVNSVAVYLHRAKKQLRDLYGKQ